MGSNGGGRSTTTTSRSRSTSRSNARLPSRFVAYASLDLRRGFITYFAAMTMILLHASLMAEGASQLVAAATSTKATEGGGEVEDGSSNVVGADHPPPIGSEDKDIILRKILESDGDTAKAKNSITTLTGFGNAVGPGPGPDLDDFVKETGYRYRYGSCQVYY